MIIQHDGEVYTSRIETAKTSMFLPSVSVGAVVIEFGTKSYRKLHDLADLERDEDACVRETFDKVLQLKMQETALQGGKQG